VQAKVIKLVGLKRPPFLSPTNLITFACTQNGELNCSNDRLFVIIVFWNMTIFKTLFMLLLLTKIVAIPGNDFPDEGNKPLLKRRN
jgi:hypothetical protein